MNANANAHPGTVTRPLILKRLWRAFNRWRKRYMWIRLLFLLLFGVYVCREAFSPLIVRLVRIAISAINVGSEPSLLNAGARFNRVRLAHHLRLSLHLVVDADHDGSLNPGELSRLRHFGLEAEDLARRSIDLNLPKLIQASHGAGLLSGSYTASIARHDAWFAAETEARETKKPIHAEIDAMLKAWRVPDYGRLETWRRGASRFLFHLSEVLFVLGSPGTVAAWLLLCFFVALMATAYVRRGKFAVSLLLGSVIALLVAFYGSFYLMFDRLFIEVFGYDLTWFATAVGFVCLSIPCAGYAGHIAGGERGSRLYFSAGALGLGITLLVWALPRWLSGRAFTPGPDEGHWLLWQLMTGDRLLQRQIPGWVKDVAVPLAVLSLVAGALGFAGLPGFRRIKKAKPRSQQPQEQGEGQGR